MIYYCRQSDPIRATTTLATRPPQVLKHSEKNAVIKIFLLISREADNEYYSFTLQALSLSDEFYKMINTFQRKHR